MNAEARRLLLAVAATACGDAPVPAQADWRGAYQALAWHGLIPLAERAYRQAGGSSPKELGRMLQKGRVAWAARALCLRQSLRTVLLAFGAAGLGVIVLKGPALAETVYPDPLLRPFDDLDLLCREEDWPAIHETVTLAGFSETRVEPTPPPKAWREKAYYHNQYFNPAVAVSLEIHFDLWHTGLRPRLGDLYWDRAPTSRVAAMEAKVLSPADQLIHAAVHLHQHSYARLIWFVDLALLLRRYGADLDWDYVIEVARKEGVGLSLYYALYYEQQLLGVPAPAAVLAALKPSPWQAWFHDQLWAPRRVLELGSKRRVEFGIREVPRAGETLRDFLLLSRSLDKLVYFAHLLLPPGAWLGRYYGVDDPDILRRRRLVHAPKQVLAAVRGCYRALPSLVSEVEESLAAELPSG
jgi:hypothetical protein